MNQTKIELPKHPCIIWYSSNSDDSLGLLFINGVFQHYIIGDEYREEKLVKETRIPAGIYPLDLKTYAGFHERYSKKFKKMHKGMVRLNNVPNFSEILYHIMNDEGDTDGCVGGGETANNNQITPGFTGSSTTAYVRTYPKFVDYIQKNQNPVLEVIEIDQ